MDIWKRIDVAEAYLVSSMFKEAASRASSIIRHTHITTESIDELQLGQIRESAGMIFVQSMREMGRTSALFIELQRLFGSVAEIPVQVFLTAVCMHISEGLSSRLQSFFEEFLSNWTYSEGESCALRKSKVPESSSGGNTSQFVIHAEKYLEVAEVYAITYLGVVLHRPDIAISWTEKAELPERNRQDMLRRLRSMCPVTGCNGEGLSKTIKPQCHPNQDQPNSTLSKFVLTTVGHMSGRIKAWINPQLLVPGGMTIFIGSFLFFAYSAYRKGRTNL